MKTFYMTYVLFLLAGTEEVKQDGIPLVCSVFTNPLIIIRIHSELRLAVFEVNNKLDELVNLTKFTGLDFGLQFIIYRSPRTGV